MRKAGERAASLTRQLLAFSRQQMLAPKNLFLDEQAREAERMLRRVIGEHIAITIRACTKAGPVRADPCQIDQVLLNLAVNARDAMPGGGRLTIEIQCVELEAKSLPEPADIRPGPYVLLTVSDTGHGMTPEILDRIFEPFFTTKEVGKGTGLGLATVYGIVKQGGGHIDVASEPGKGTTFRIYWPHFVGALTAVNKPPSGFFRKTSGHETVLLVEDEEALRVLARHVLEGSGYKVLEAGHGGEALLICQQHAEPIHLVLSDVVMPQMGGRELVDHLAQLRPDVKVLFCSGYTADVMKQHGILETTAEFLQKPFTPEALVRKVREVLDR
jgi:CheY-like chemotaxis protein